MLVAVEVISVIFFCRDPNTVNTVYQSMYMTFMFERCPVACCWAEIKFVHGSNTINKLKQIWQKQSYEKGLVILYMDLDDSRHYSFYNVDGFDMHIKFPKYAQYIVRMNKVLLVYSPGTWSVKIQHR